MIAEDFGSVRVLATESIAGTTVEVACARTEPKDRRGLHLCGLGLQPDEAAYLAVADDIGCRSTSGFGCPETLHEPSSWLLAQATW